MKQPSHASVCAHVKTKWHRTAARADQLTLKASAKYEQAQKELDPALAPIWQSEAETYSDAADAAHARADTLYQRARDLDCIP